MRDLCSPSLRIPLASGLVQRTHDVEAPCHSSLGEQKNWGSAGVVEPLQLSSQFRDSLAAAVAFTSAQTPPTPAGLVIGGGEERRDYPAPPLPTKEQPPITTHTHTHTHTTHTSTHENRKVSSDTLIRVARFRQRERSATPTPPSTPTPPRTHTPTTDANATHPFLSSQHHIRPLATAVPVLHHRLAPLPHSFLRRARHLSTAGAGSIQSIPSGPFAFSFCAPAESRETGIPPRLRPTHRASSSPV